MPDLEIRARLWPQFLSGVLFIALYQGISVMREGHTTASFPVVVAMGLAFAVVNYVVRKRRSDLTLRDGVLTGPPRYGLSQVSMRVADIDAQRSAEPLLFGGLTVWSKSGEAIRVDALSYSAPDRARLVQALKL